MSKSKSKIITVPTYPPIPMRDCDWCAYRYGQEELGNYGWGPTELEAVHDLLKIEADDAEYAEEQSYDYFNHYIAGDR